MLPCPCEQRGVRSRPVVSLLTRALCDCLASSSNLVPPWSEECAATGSRKARIVRSTSPRCLPSGSHSVDDRSRSAPSSTEFPGCLSGKALPRTHGFQKGSLRCSSCSSSLDAPVAAMQAGCPPGHCKDNTSNDPFSRCKKCATIWLQVKLTIPEYSLTASAQLNYKKLCIWNYVCVVKTYNTNDNVTTETQSTFNIAHMNTDT